MRRIECLLLVFMCVVALLSGCKTVRKVTEATSATQESTEPAQWEPYDGNGKN